jgi:MSHA biogenesis protein MshN
MVVWGINAVSVINQMLKDLEQNPPPSPSLSQSNLQTGVVTVSQHCGNKKILVALVASITLVTGLAGYLLMQDTVVSATVSSDSVTVMPSIAAPVQMAREVAVDSGSEPVTDNAEQVMQATLIQAPAVSREQAIAAQTIANQTIATQTIATQTIATQTIDPQTMASQVAPAEPTKEVTVQPPAKKQVARTKQVVVTKPRLAEPVSITAETSENSISIKPITRTRQQQAQLYAQQAEQALLTGDKEQAKRSFSQVLKLDSRHDQAREKLAALLYGEKRTKSAVAILREGLAVSPEYTNFRLMLARIFMQNKNKQQAYYYLKPHQPEIAGHIDYYAMLAGLAQNLGDLDTARSAYLKLTAHEPNRAKWWLGLGITADKSQQNKLALTAYHKAQTMGQLSAASRNYIDTRITQLEK